MSESFEELVETFEFLDDWEDRYGHVISMGRAMDPLEETERNQTTKVDGCASQVWLVPEVAGTGPEATISFRGESDAMIVKGLIAVLIALVSGRTAKDISTLDIPAEMARLGLDKHLSAQRSNGLRAMIGRIQAIAAASMKA
ncbi:MAG: SufE family protein [Pseudomonadota bacterium]